MFTVHNMRRPAMCEIIEINISPDVSMNAGNAELLSDVLICQAGKHHSSDVHRTKSEGKR